MRKFLAAITLAILTFSCENQDPQEQVKYLEGYWEIEKVEISRDSVKEYTFNENVDFIEIENNKGFRKKVRPQLNGTYKITGDTEKLEIKIEKGNLYLYYSTPYDTWREKVVRAEENELEIENEQGLVYYYKRYTPLLIERNEAE